MDLDLQQASIVEVRTNQLKELHNKYINQHPELQQILNDFVAQTLLHKPQDVIFFAKQYFSKFNPTPSRTKPLALIGPSGVGKSTFINDLMKNYQEAFEFSVSTTTRQPRQGEVHGKHYYFVQKEEFKAKIERNEFIEWAEVHSNYYGTSLEAINEISSRGKICILDIDVQGVLKIYESGIEFNRIFIMPHSMKQLEERLRARGGMDDSVLRIRLRNAQAEIETAQSNPHIFQDFVENNEIERGLQDFYYLIRRYYEHLFKQINGVL